MGRLSYVIRRAAKMDYGAMLKTAGRLHEKTGKSRGKCGFFGSLSVYNREGLWYNT